MCLLLATVPFLSGIQYNFNVFDFIEYYFVNLQNENGILSNVIILFTIYDIFVWFNLIMV